MSIVQFLSTVNGIAQLFANDGQFLGVLSSDQYDLNSISNPHGMYGSQHGIYSIRNSCGLYGGSYGIYSPYNTYCINPPIVFYQGQPILIVSKNNHVVSNHLPIVDPDLVLGVYAQLANSMYTTNHYLQTQRYVWNMFNLDCF
jgi:hypothetical protein